MSFDKSILRPGQFLIYEASSLFGYAIAIFTRSRISHIEMYRGNDESFASRDGVGVDIYPFRESNLAYVLESPTPLKMERIEKGFADLKGNAYDNATIIKHATFGLSQGRTQAEVCSELQCYLARIGGLYSLFGAKQPDEITPHDFVHAMEMGILRTVWRKT